MGKTKYSLIPLLIITVCCAEFPNNSTRSYEEEITIDPLKKDSNIYPSRQEIYNITNLEYFTCTDALVDCSASGVCSKDQDECICFEGFKTVFKQPEDYFSKKPRCNYAQKKQFYAVIIALFISFGFTHFYLGNYILGYIQLIVFLSILSANIFIITKLSLKHIKKVSQLEYRQTLSLMLVVCFFSLISFFWYAFDIFMVLFNVYKDDNNVELHSSFPNN